MIPFPSHVAPGLAAWAESLMQDVRKLSNPVGPTLLYRTTTANMPPAADHIGRVLHNTTLNILAVSDGTSWIRQDTGVAI